MISKEIVEEMAMLGRLALTKEEIENYSDQLGKIVKNMEILQELDTQGVEPLIHISPVENVVRPDEIGQMLAKEKALANAPSKEDGMFSVPKIV